MYHIIQVPFRIIAKSQAPSLFCDNFAKMYFTVAKTVEQSVLRATIRATVADDSDLIIGENNGSTLQSMEVPFWKPGFF